MSQSLAKNLIHLVFSTKGREAILPERSRDQLHRYLAGILKDLDCPALAMNSVRDHVHILFLLHKNRALADVVMEVKRGSSRWLKTQDPALAEFHWQSGYGAFSISQSSVKEVEAYLASQEAHHRVKSFQEELKAFLTRYGIEFDERYVWD